MTQETHLITSWPLPERRPGVWIELRAVPRTRTLDSSQTFERRVGVVYTTDPTPLEWVGTFCPQRGYLCIGQVEQAALPD